VEEERGRDAGAGGGSWAAVHCAGWAEELGRAAGRREGGERRQAAGRGREFWAQPDSEGKR